ncbi:MAG: Cys-Gln thioester bond-forming surface protein [Bacilli bacterium]|nr:Cys-Gln thioester bond-forming surface protein [Bacilli bacterium]
MKKSKWSLLFIGILCFLGMLVNVKAESYIASSLPDTFTTNVTGRWDNSEPAREINPTADEVIANKSVTGAMGSVGGNNVINYHTRDLVKVFCIDRTKPYATGANYKKSGKTVDPKIVYIITHAQEYYNKAFGGQAGTANTQDNDAELAWMTQVAIWQFQNANNFAGLNVNTNDIEESGAQINSVTSVTYSNRAIKLWQTAQTLVAAAKGANTTVLDSIQFAYDGKYTIDKNSKTIKTSLISIVNLGSLKVTLDTSKMPQGTKIYNEAGQETAQVDASTKFYFVVPINNIDNYSVKAKITATIDNYEYYTGYEYIHSTDNTKQPLVLVVKEKKPISGALNIDASHVEDTAISMSSSIYFVGFIILLCGAGIIYANVKPKKQTNE